MALTADQVQKFYIGYYGRPADPVGLTYWQNQDEAAALKGFSGSDEFTNQFPIGMSASQKVTQVYNNLLGRAPDTAGLLYWAGELTAGRESIGTLVLSMIKNALGKDVTTIEDRVTYSNSFTAALDTPAEINAYAGAAATQTARTALLKVVANSVGDHTALNAEVKNIDTTVATIVSGGSGGGTPGQPFTLTTVVGESIVGTAGDDTISGVLTFIAGGPDGANSTLNIGDQIDGGAGTDTFNLVLSGAAAVVGTANLPAGAIVKNVEVVNLTHTDNAATGAAVLNSGSYTGVQQLWQVDNSAAAGTFGAVTVGTGVTAGFRSTGATTAQDVLPAASINAANATQTTLAAAIDGVGDDSSLVFVGAGVKTVTLSGSVGAEATGIVGDLAVSTAGTIAETLKMSFTSGVQLALVGNAALKTIDMSGSTGGILANTVGANTGTTIVTGANLTSFKTGSGNDNINLTLGAGTADVAIDVGAGNDTLTLTGALNDNGDSATVTLGAGKDTVNFNGIVNLGAGVTTVTDLTDRLVTVTDFKTSEDVLNLGGFGLALNSTQLETIKGAADLLAAVTAVAAITDVAVAGGAAQSAAVFSFGGDAYVFVDNTNGALNVADGLIKLTGVDATLFTNIQNGNLVL